MNHKEKQSITHYISIRFAAIILIMAAIMILFISYFSNKTIYFDIRRQIRRESRYDFLNIEVRNGKILVDKNFIFRENHVQKLVLDSQGRTIRGHYPDKELNNYPLNQWDFRRVKCSSGYYYIFDRPFLKKDIITNKQILVIIRNIGKETDFNSQYQAMKYISYTFTFVISIIGLLLIGAVSSRLTIPMKEIKDTADTIGIEGNLAKRIESATAFKEMDAMIQANNRMMDRLEQGRIKEDFEYSCLKDLIESICEAEPLRMQKQISVQYDLKNISIYMNISLMAIAIKNLINNAMKYSENQSFVKLRLWEKDNLAIFEIEDHGCGMDEETQKHIYDRFYRADKSRNTPGFGLGLSLVQKITELHKGSISVKSKVNEGSVFTLSLPKEAAISNMRSQEAF